MSELLLDAFQRALDDKRNTNSLRSLQVESDKVDFCSNDYLGLSRSLALANRIAEIIDEYSFLPRGSTGSRLISGNNSLFERVEQSVAAFHGAKSALFCNSGYVANLCVFSTLAGRGDTILYDELIHASVRDGIRLSYAKGHSFRHNDLSDLETKCINARGNVFVAVEAVYSMDGDCAPLVELVSICERYNASLIVDEAHSTGVYGRSGKGLCEELGVLDHVFARVVTFGKAVGSHGAVILGDQRIREYLINFARPFFYTTATTKSTLAEVLAAYEYLESVPIELAKLKQNIEFFRSKAFELEIPHLLESNSAVQCILIPGCAQAREVAFHLQELGFDVRAILSPTVTEGKERIRICLHAFNTSLEIEQLLLELRKLVR